MSAPNGSPASPWKYRERSTEISLHGKPLTMHLASSMASSSSAPIVLYASGDGGWFGAAVDMFHSIAGAGYPTVGVSSRSFLKLESPHNAPLNETHLAADYSAILDEARVDLHLQPDTPAILTGWSRGAAFAVIAATKMTGSAQIDGVVAIGLDQGEDLKLDADDSDDDAQQAMASGTPQHWPFETYPLIKSLDPLPVAVIQSTHDGYLSASRARELFGPDTPSRRLTPIEAKNHRFSNGRDAFRAALTDALAWISRHDR